MVEHKEQHWVPACYLQAWCDPEKPPLYDPYVHVFDRLGGSYHKKSPSNLFKKPDLYTVYEGGQRDLRIEHTFGRLETGFVRVRGMLEAEQLLDGDDAGDLYLFVGAMIARPPSRITSTQKQWASIAETMKGMRINPNVPPVRSLISGPSLNLAQVQEAADNPMGTWFPESVAAHINALIELFGCDVLVNGSDTPFITSDAPAVIYHPPLGYLRFVRGLSSPGCEITLPLSPRLALLFRHKTPGLHAFLNAKWEDVFEVNRRTILSAKEHIVSDRPDIYFVKAITEFLANRP